MKETLERTFKAFKLIDGRESAESQYSLFRRTIVDSVAGERDKVYNDPKLYKEALEEAEKRKEANIQTLISRR